MLSRLFYAVQHKTKKSVKKKKKNLLQGSNKTNGLSQKKGTDINPFLANVPI